MTVTIERFSERLAKQEAVIEQGEKAFIAVGKALMVIREERLYKAAGYSSFETYCHERWKWSKPYVIRQISAAKTAKAVPFGTAPPENEAQARELARVPEEKRGKVWKETQRRATSAETKVTARLIREVAEGEPSPPVCRHCEIHCP